MDLAPLSWLVSPGDRQEAQINCQLRLFSCLAACAWWNIPSAPNLHTEINEEGFFSSSFHRPNCSEIFIGYQGQKTSGKGRQGELDPRCCRDMPKTIEHLPVPSWGFIGADLYTEFSLKSIGCNWEISTVWFFENFPLRIKRPGAFGKGIERWDFILILPLINCITLGRLITSVESVSSFKIRMISLDCHGDCMSWWRNITSPQCWSLQGLRVPRKF